jgi:hypothetical protein
MTPRDRLFFGGAVLLSLAGPAGLLALRPFDEARATLGLLAGWGAALLIIAASYVWLRRVLAQPNAHAFLRGFMAGSVLRLLAAVGVLVAWSFLAPEASLSSFLLSFMLGYVLLTGVELVAMLRGARKGVSA